MILYKIKEWSKVYENAQSRKCEKLNWVPVPARHDAERYCEMMEREDAAEIFSAWIICLQVGARSHPRGNLVRSDGSPHTPVTLAIKTRGRQKWFEKALPYLSEIGWLEQVTYEDKQNTTPLPVECESPGQEGRKEGTEGTEGKKELAEDVDEVFELWNACESLPKIMVISDKRKASVRARLKDRFFAENWRAALVKIKESDFCTGKNERGWKADMEFFLKPDTVAKIMEGKYDNKTGFHKSSFVTPKIRPSLSEREAV